MKAAREFVSDLAAGFFSPASTNVADGMNVPATTIIVPNRIVFHLSVRYQLSSSSRSAATPY